MESIEKSVPVSQASTNINDAQSESGLHVVERSGSHPTPSSSRRLEQPPADKRDIDEWIPHHATKFQDNGGVVEEMMSLTLRYFDEVILAAENYQGATSVLWVSEQQKRFRLLKNGDSNLDRRLSENLAVRELIVSNLNALLLAFRTGIPFFSPECQQTFVEDTNRVFEQASAITSLSSHLEQPASYPAIDLPKFCDLEKIEITSRIDHLFTLLPSTQHLVENFEERGPRQVEEDGRDVNWPFPGKGIERVRTDIRQLHPVSESSYTSHGDKNSRRPHSNLSNSRTQQLSGSTDSSSTSSSCSHDDTHESAHLLTDTVTSIPSSEVKHSSTESTNSNSAIASLRCKKSRTAFSDLASLENHGCRTHGVIRLRRRIASLFSPLKSQNKKSEHEQLGKSQNKKFEHEQLVKVWHQNGRDYECCIMLLDTGCDDNLIHRSIVEKLELDIIQSRPVRYVSFGHSFQSSERVRPVWQLKTGSRRHQQFPFSVVPTDISSEIDMVLGKIAMQELGLTLQGPRNALVAHREGLSTLEKQQQQEQGGQQIHDDNVRQAKIRQEFAAKHEALVKEKNEANATKTVEPSNSKSQKAATGTGNSQQ